MLVGSQNLEKQSQWLVFATLVVFIFQPLANFSAFNYFQNSFSALRTVGYFIILLTISYICLVLLRYLFKRLKITILALVIGFSVLTLFNNYLIEQGLHQILRDGFRFRYIFFADVIIFLLVLPCSVWIANHKSFHHAILMAVLAISLTDIALIKSKELAHYDSLDVKPYHELVKISNTPNADRMPNVYFIVPDGFLGPEMLRKLSEQNITIDIELEKRNFVVNKQAFSNSTSTSLSLPIVYTMNYLFDDGEIISHKKFNELEKLYQQDNPVFAEFRRRGYQFIRLADGMGSKCVGNEDRCIKKHSFYTTQDMIFANRTLIPSTLAHLFFWSKGLIPGMMEINEFIPYLPDPQTGPYFVHAHFTLPHAPFRFKADCSPLGFSSMYAANDFYFDLESASSRFDIEFGQTMCCQKMLLEFVDNIRQRDPNSIIIIQADHGTHTYDKVNTNFQSMKKEYFQESFNILSAFYGPASFTQHLNKQFSPVNTFRMLFAWMDDQEPNLLPHRSLFGILDKEMLAEKDGMFIIHEWQPVKVE